MYSSQKCLNYTKYEVNNKLKDKVAGKFILSDSDLKPQNIWITQKKFSSLI